MLVQPQPRQFRGRIDRPHLIQRQPGIKRVQDGDQPPDDHASLSAGEGEPLARHLGVQPDLARTTLHLQRVDLQRRIKGGHRAADLDHMPIAVLQPSRKAKVSTSSSKAALAIGVLHPSPSGRRPPAGRPEALFKPGLSATPLASPEPKA